MKIYKSTIMITLVVLLTCLVTTLTYAQGDKPKNKNNERTADRDMMKQRIEDLNNREFALHALDLQRNNYDSKENLERIRREEIANNLRQLVENNEKLFFLTTSLDERRLKDAAGLANKLASASKDLRRNLELKGKKDSNNSSENPLSAEEKMGEIRQLATKLNDLIGQVVKAQTIGSVDASQIDETEKNLQEIESNASRLKSLAGKK